MTKEKRLKYGIKEMRQSGLSYMERGEKIKEIQGLGVSKKPPIIKKLPTVEKPLVKKPPIEQKIGFWKRIWLFIKKLLKRWKSCYN